MINFRHSFYYTFMLVQRKRRNVFEARTMMQIMELIDLILCELFTFILFFF